MKNFLELAMALSSDEEQGDCINTFARFLRKVCANRLEAQLCMICEHLDGDGREMVKLLEKFVRLDEAAPKVDRVRRIVYDDEDGRALALNIIGRLENVASGPLSDELRADIDRLIGGEGWAP